jgi:hypothetical protein
MKLTTLVPFILITIIWSFYSDRIDGINAASVGTATGTLLGYLGIPYAIAIFSIKKSTLNYENRRLKVFIISWLIFMGILVINYSNNI